MPGQAPAQQILEARVGGGGHRDRVAVAAEAAGEPETLTGRRRSPLMSPMRSCRGTPGWRGRLRVLDQRVEVLLERAVQVPVAGAAGDEPRPRQAASACEIDGRSAADQLAQQPVGERQRQRAARRARPAPSARPGATAAAPAGPRAAAGTRSPAGCSQVGAAALGAAQERRARSAARAAHARRNRRRAARSGWGAAPARPPRSSSVVDAPAQRLEQVAGAEQLGDRAIDDAGVDDDQAVEEQEPRAAAGGVEPRPKVARAGPGLEHPGRRQLASGDAHAHVELLGQVVVGVEDVAQTAAGCPGAWHGPTVPASRGVSAGRRRSTPLVACVRASESTNAPRPSVTRATVSVGN